MATATTMNKEFGSSSIEDDFNYGTNVASAHIYVRMQFLRKVYGILTIQLILTTAVGALFLLTPQIKSFVQTNTWMISLAFISSLVVLIALQFKRQEYPTNFILLLLFTVIEAYTIGTIVTFYDKLVVLEAFALTIAITAALTVYTLQSKRDFTSWGAMLFSSLWILIMASFFQFFFHSETYDFVIACGGAVLFSAMIIFDTSMIMRKLSPDEYILAVINLYLDILNLFLYILRILQQSRHN